MTYKIGKAESDEEKRHLSEELLANLRQIDREEIEGMGATAEEGVQASILYTWPVYYGRNMDNGKLVACWGLQHLRQNGETICLIWCLGTDEIKKVKKSFMLESSKILRQWAAEYGELTNTVGTFNKDSMLWLKWLGADFGKPFLLGGKEYVKFYLRKVKKHKAKQGGI